MSRTQINILALLVGFLLASSAGVASAENLICTEIDAFNTCLNWVVESVDIDYAIYGITPATILYVYTWGAGAILMMWGIAYAISSGKLAVKKI